LIFGEDEELIKEAIQDYREGKLKDEYHRNKALDINRYPFPHRKFLPHVTIARKNMMDLKRRKDYEDLLGTTVIFSRGCPY